MFLKKKEKNEENLFFLDFFLDFFSFLGSIFVYLVILLISFFHNILLFKKLFFGLFFILFTIISFRLIFYKPRPIPKKYDNIFEKIQASSFPSGHVLIISLIIFLILEFYDFNFYIQFLLFLFIFFTGFSRYYKKKHYIEDLVFGFVFSLVIFLFLKIII